MFHSPSDSHVSELVGDGEGGAEPVVLDDGAAVVVAHCGELGQAQSVAVLLVQQRVATDVLPETEV